VASGGTAATFGTEDSVGAEESPAWRDAVTLAAERYGTPCYVARWDPIQDAVSTLERQLQSPVPVRSWLSFKTHPLPPLVREWIASGRGVEVVSEFELNLVLRLGCTVDALLVNGVAKHAWLPRYPLPELRVHFDSEREVAELLPVALAQRWRVGVRCHAPDECDARDSRFGGQFGMTADEAVDSLRRLLSAGAQVESVHFHLGQHPQTADAYLRGVDHLAAICEAARFSPRFVDCGGGLPSRQVAGAAVDGLASAIRAAHARFDALEELWLENGRFISEDSAVLAVRVLDVKERDDSRYLICDGGRTNHALAADKGLHPLLLAPDRHGEPRLTTICGPTCMTDDTLGRALLPGDVQPGDVIAWTGAGAYHLPWETRFSHGLCAVAWCGADGVMRLARERERPDQWPQQWDLSIV
jgi:diaminopimelate decarboxylase